MTADIHDLWKNLRQPYADQMEIAAKASGGDKTRSK